MQDPTAEGNDFFKCDFCRRGWTWENPMIEGHQGSIICADCMTIAFTDMAAGENLAPDGYTCTTCLEQRDQIGWRSPKFEEALICKRCLKQAATRLEKDEDFTWTRPAVEI